MKRLFLPTLLVFGFIVRLAVAGDVPQVMNFQGRLDNANGTPIMDSTYTVDFRIFDHPTGGNLLWDETQQVPTVDGVFSVVLGSVVPIPGTVFNSDSTFLEVEPIGFGAITPRSRLTSVAYARRAEDADLLDGVPASELEESQEIQNAITQHQLAVNAHHTKTVNADELIAGTLSEARLPHKAIDSSEVQDNSIYAAQLADEPGIAHSFESLKLIGTNTTVLDSAYLVPPAFGYVLVIASGWFYENHVGTDVSVILSLSVDRDSIDFNHTARFEVRPTAPSGNTVENFTIQRVVTAFQGQPVRVFLLGRRSGTGLPNVENLQINAMYFPTSYGTIDSPSSQ